VIGGELLAGSRQPPTTGLTVQKKLKFIIRLLPAPQAGAAGVSSL